MILAYFIAPRFRHSDKMSVFTLTACLFLFEEGFLLSMVWYVLKLKGII